MIIYKNVLERLKQAGYSSYVLMKTGAIGQGAISNIRNGRPVSLATIDTVCRLLKCQPGDILEYVETEEPPASE